MVTVHEWPTGPLHFAASARRLQWAIIAALTSQHDSIAASRDTDTLLSAFSAQWQNGDPPTPKNIGVG